MTDKKPESADLRAFIADWPHDPRRATREPMTGDEALKLLDPTPSPMQQAIEDLCEARKVQYELDTYVVLIPPENVEAAKAMGIEVIEVPAGGVPKFRSLRERLDNPPPALALPPERTQAEADARDSARDVFRVIDATFGTPEELRAKLDACMRDDPTRLQCTWEQAQKVDFTDRTLTLYEFFGGGKRLTWASDGTVFVQEVFWEPGEVEALVNPEVVETPREEFSAWLERDGLREER